MRVEFDINGTYCCRGVNTIVKNWCPAVRFQYLIANIIAIKDGDRTAPESLITGRIKHFKEMRFCPAVGINGFVKIQVLMGDVRNNSYIEAASSQTLQHKAM